MIFKESLIDMKVVVFGLGKMFNYFMMNKKNDSLAKEMDVVYLSDNDNVFENGNIFGGTFVKATDLPRYIKEGNIEAVIITIAYPNNTYVITQLREMEITVPIYTLVSKPDESEMLYEINECKPTLSYIECDIVDHCNLRCNGCGHKSNIANEHYLDLDMFKIDFQRLAQLFSNISTIRVMGGEPLLHPQVTDFLKVAKESFPNSDVRLVTNGLLIPAVNESIFDYISKNGITVDISLYMPTFKRWHEIKKVLKMHNVRYQLGEPVTRFLRGTDVVKRDYRDVFSKCKTTCTTLRDGKISRCGFERGIPILSEYFNKRDWDIDESMPSLIDIHEEGLDGWEIVNRLNKPFAACSYCRTGNYENDALYDEKLTRPWRCNQKPTLSDW